MSPVFFPLMHVLTLIFMAVTHGSVLHTHISDCALDTPNLMSPWVPHPQLGRNWTGHLLYILNLRGLGLHPVNFLVLILSWPIYSLRLETWKLSSVLSSLSLPGQHGHCVFPSHLLCLTFFPFVLDFSSFGSWTVPLDSRSLALLLYTPFPPCLHSNPSMWNCVGLSLKALEWLLVAKKLWILNLVYKICRI